MNITHDIERKNINRYAAQNNGETQPYKENNNTLQIAYPNLRNFNLASKLNVLNIYFFTIINEFCKDNRFLKVTDHEYIARIF